MSTHLHVVAARETESAAAAKTLPADVRPVFDLQDAGVAYGFGRGKQALHALRDVTLAIAPGESVALVGSNGSGKSTLLRVLHGLIRSTSGHARSDPTLQQAMLFQRPFMLRMSAQNNVALALWLRGRKSRMSWLEARERALEAIARVELSDKALQSARQLSGGQQQRLALARAWALNPDVLLLDEPTASLDPHAKREVEELVAEFIAARERTRPVTLVFASHNLGQVKRLATRVIYLEQGRVLADLPVADFFNQAHLQSVSSAAALFVKGELA